MNKHCYRIVFNKARGLLMAVAETVNNQGKTPGTGSGGTASTAWSKANFGAVRLLSIAVWSALGLVTWIDTAYAQIVVDPNAPGNQRPTVLQSANGVPLVNIQTPSAAGVSRNTYSQFDVQQQGVILNNASTNAQTQLGGWVQGNPWLANGTARVILNEVNSSNPSLLRGYAEVAGTRAQVVIANPAGVTCDGCGFLNASRATLTTGTPIINNGSLDGYRVQGGVIAITGTGMDARDADYTDLISRSMQINAGIWAKELKVTAGANQVDAANTQATPIQGTGTAPTVGIDVAQLGGMYAGKITLVGTEAGVGVRNAGQIGASAGDIVVTANGRLENAGSMTATGNMQLNADNGIQNSGTLYAQTDTALSTRGDIDNSGVIAAQNNTTLAASGATSNITSTSGAVLGAGIQGDGSVGTSGSLTVNATQTVTAQGQNTSGGNQSMTAQAINLAGSQTSAQNLDLHATQGDLDLRTATVSVVQGVTANAAQTLRTDQAQVTANQVNIAAHDLSNVHGSILQVGTGDMLLNLPGQLDNTQGRIATNSQNLTLSAGTITNTNGALEHAGTGNFTLTANTLDGTQGRIVSNGQLALTATSATLDGGTTVAQQLQIDSATLSNQGGTLQQTGDGAASIHATNRLDNTGGTVLSNGNVTLEVGDLVNDGGTIQASGSTPADLAIHATGNISNRAQAGTAGKINASGNVDITANQLDNHSGQITASRLLNASTTHDLLNQQGTLAANQDVTLNAGALDNTQGTVGSVQGALGVTASSGALANAGGHMEAAKAATVSAQGLNNAGGAISGSSVALNSQLQTLDNVGGIISATSANGDGTIDIQSGALNNDTGLISAQGALAIDTHGQTLTNTNSGTAGGIVGQATVSLTTGGLDNRAGYIGSAGAFSLDGAAIDNSQGGILTSAAQLDLNGTALDNQGGQIQVVGNANITTSGNVVNSHGLIRSGQTLTVNADTIDNSNTQDNDQGLEGDRVSVTANHIGNRKGTVRANTVATLTSAGTIDNTQGTVSSAGTVTLQDAHLANKTLAITNTGGTLIAGHQLAVDSASLGGDGSLLSQGDLSVKVKSDYTQTGQLQANGAATVETAGTLTNASTMAAGTALNLTAATIDNQANGQIQSNTVSLHATDVHTLTNRGLINGSNTFIDTVTLNNLGTGRIYGDHVAIHADTLTNAAENGTAPVIAARDRLDIGAGTLTNSEHALIFSAGDLAIGGSLGAGKQATGQATALNNNSATIEASGNVDIAAGQINNNNLHFSTAEVATGTQSITEYQGSGSPNRYAAGTPDLYTYVDESVHLHTPEGNYESWTLYQYNRNTTQTQVQSTDPGKILAGGNMHLAADTLNNNNSSVIAGGDLVGNVTNLNNPAAQGTITTDDVGTATSYWRWHRKGTDSTDSSTASYQTASIQPISLTTMVYQGHTTAGVSGTQIANVSAGNVNQSASGASAATSNVHSAATVTPITQVPTPDSSGSGGASMVVRTGGVNTNVPNNSLYGVPPGPGAHYLVATDPAFADYRTWLSSDYMLSALSLNPAATQARLGDGFYEQRLVNEQVAQLTGRRHLDGYTSDETEYQALMNNGVTFAHAQQLTPGVALTEAQMAALTSDIVWLVEKDVTLPNGQTTKALVPQVYVRVQDGDLQSNGALLAGNNVNLNVTGDLVNSGTIAGRNVVSLTAENIHNLGGRITGNDVAVAARTDLNNIGGAIDAARSLTATAGHDLNVVSTVNTQSNAQSSTTNIGRVAGLYVTGSSGTLTAAAGHDLNLTAATISNGTGSSEAGGSTLLAAGNNINLGTVTESASHQIIWDSKNQRQDSTSTEVGTNIHTQGNIQMQAGADLNARGAAITSDQGAVQLLAGRDVNLTAAETRQTVDEAHQHKGKSGMFSSKTITTRDTLDQTTAHGTIVSGNTTDIEANHDINLTGSNAVSTAGTALVAQNDINVKAAVTTTKESHLLVEKTSGMFSGGGIGVTIGTQEQSTAQQATHTTASAATVGSTQGDIVIAAGNHYAQTGSDVLAPQGNVGITAKHVDITEARNTDDSLIETKFKQSGLTVAISSPVISAIQTAQQMKRASGQTSDGRMKLLAGATTALAGKSAVDAVQSNPGQAGGVNISISIGSSQSKSDTHEASNTAAGSNVAAGNDVSIHATGAGKDSNLTVQGSSIKAGNNIDLQADNQINLMAAQNTDEQHSTNSSSSGSIGVSFGTDGFLVTASASGGRGHADGTDVNWTNTHVDAGNQLAMQSGGDTTIKGAVASGRQVTAQVGGNLNIESLQDTSTYDSKQQSIGGSISVGMGKMGGSLSFSNSKANSNYASVNEQSGIKAGDGGFDVNVSGNTDLKGGAITSTQAAVDNNSNHFNSGALTTSDIQNSASYNASAVGVNIGASVNQTGKYQPNGTSAGIGSDSGNANSITQAAITGIAGNKDARTGDKESGIGKIFDADKVQKNINAQVTITQAFGQAAAKEIGTYATHKVDGLHRQADVALKAGDQASADALNAEADKWDEGGAYRVAMHTAVGALTGGAQGAAGAFTSAEAMPQIAKIVDGMDLPPAVKSGLEQVTATALGAVVGGTAGAATALNAEANNRQLHQSEINLIKKKANGDTAVEDRLTKAACYEVKCWMQYPEGSKEYNANYVDVMTAYSLKDETAWIKSQQANGQFIYSAMNSITDRMQSTDLPVIKDGIKVATGWLTATGGLALCGTGPGCVPGSLMTAFGSSTMIEGASGLYNAYNGSSAPGVNPLRTGFNQLSPTWGNTVYDGLNLTATIMAMGVQVPLKVGVSDGINRTESIFGSTISRFNNPTLNPLTKLPLPYGVTQGTLLYGAGSQGATLIDDVHKAGE
jgi:filamentous hemagglutinin